MANPVQQIHRFFAKHGSPVASHAGTIVRASRRYGVNPYQVAAHIMAETEGGLTGTGRPGQYNLTGVGGVGHMRRYPNYDASIIDTVRNLASPRYKGKPIAVQAAMWVAGTGPTAKTQPYANTIMKFMKMAGGGKAMSYTALPPGRPSQRLTRASRGIPGMGSLRPAAPTIAPVLANLLSGMAPELGGVINMLAGSNKFVKLAQHPSGGFKPYAKIPHRLDGTPDNIMALLHAAQTVSQHSAGYSKATARGPLKNVSVNSALDCSLSVAKVLQMAGLGFGPNQTAPVSGQMAQSWGKPGKGKYLTMYANNEHVFIEFKIKGKFYRFDTSHHFRGEPRGPRLMRTRRSTAGFTARHWPGL